MKQYVVPHHIALLLKEVGFDEICSHEYFTDGSLSDHNYSTFIQAVKQNKVISCMAPSYEQAIEWLVEKHQLHPFVQKSSIETDWYYRVQLLDHIGKRDGSIVAHSNFVKGDRKMALNASLEKCVELIKKKK